MASFVYVARETASGREIRSSVEAATEQAAIAALLNRNLLVRLHPGKGRQARARPAAARVALADLVIFTRQLATMIDAGLAMVQSLQALAEQTTNKVMRDVIKDVCARVESGDSFSEALQKHPKAFSRLYVCMVAAGEKGGLLAEILARLATYLENTARLRKKVKSAMMYPTVVTDRGHPDHHLPAGESGAGVRRNLHELRRRRCPAPTLFLINLSNFVKKLHPSALSLAGGGGWFTAGSTSSRPQPAGCSGIRTASSCRSSARSPTRSASPGSPAPWPR